MKNLRVLGSTIQKVANERGISPEVIGEQIGVTAIQVQSLFKGRLLCSFQQLTKLANLLNTSVTSLIDGDEQYYEENVVHCMKHFTNPDNREEILDIIYDYLDVCDAVSQ